MLVEAGHFALALALGLSLIQFVVPLWGARANDPVLMSVAPTAALAVLACIAFAFFALTYAYVTSDFSVVNVVENSHSTKPLIYKISGVWGNHEGSMLLWVLILSLFGAIVALARNSVPARLQANTLAIQAAVTLAFLAFILITSNPFDRAIPAPAEGQDLNPLLQDLGLAIHPPLLYIGYVGFSISFAFACAALIDGRIDAVWARVVRPWTLTAWAFLTLGIAMGSYWAYYELGWGGWWFWDPVENASLMPWLAGTALVHSTVVMEKRDSLKVWTILLAILTFSLSLLGTFLVRSGVLTSVHSFAVDPERGTFILGILVVFIGGSLALFAWRAPMLQQGGVFAPISREGRARAQQPVSRHRLRDRLHRHALSARARSDDGRKDLGRCAVLQHDVRAADRSAAPAFAARTDARVETRQSARCGATTLRGLRAPPCCSSSRSSRSAMTDPLRHRSELASALS